MEFTWYNGIVETLKAALTLNSVCSEGRGEHTAESPGGAE